MSIQELIANFPRVNLEPLPGLTEAWTFTRGRFRTGIAVSGDPEFAFQVNCRQPTTPEYIAAVLSFAREHSNQLLNAVPFAITGGFSYPDTAFDSMIALLPSVADLNAVTAKELSKRTYAVFPGWRCEISGDESESDATERFNKQLKWSDTTRSPVPFVRIAYQRSGGGETVGERRFIMDPAFLYRQLPLYEGATTGFIEYENYTGSVRRIEWREQGPVYVDGATTHVAVQDNLVDEAQAFLLGQEE